MQRAVQLGSFLSVVALPFVFLLLLQPVVSRIVIFDSLTEDYASTRNRVLDLAAEIRSAARSFAQGIDRERVYGVARAVAEDDTRRTLFEYYVELIDLLERERSSRASSFSSAACEVGGTLSSPSSSSSSSSPFPSPPQSPGASAAAAAAADAAIPSSLPVQQASRNSETEVLMRERTARMSLLRAAAPPGDDDARIAEELRVLDMVLHGFLDVVYSAQYSTVVQTTLALGLHLDMVSPAESLPALKTTTLPTGVGYLNSLVKDYFAARLEARKVVEISQKHVDDANLVVDGSRGAQGARELALFYAECLARVEGGLPVCLSPSDPAKGEVATFVRNALRRDEDGGERATVVGSRSSDVRAQQNVDRFDGEGEDANPLERTDARLETLIEELKAVVAKRERGMEKGKGKHRVCRLERRHCRPWMEAGRESRAKKRGEEEAQPVPMQGTVEASSLSRPRHRGRPRCRTGRGHRLGTRQDRGGYSPCQTSRARGQA